MIYSADILTGTISEEEFSPVAMQDEQVDSFNYVRTLTVGEGTNVIRANNEGLWVGNGISTDAPFYVRPNGYVRIQNQTKNGFIGMSPSEGFWLGSNISENAPFYVQPNGYVRIQNKSEYGFIGMSPDKGFWLGAPTPENAFFRITPNGKVYIKSTSPNGGYIEIDGVNTRIVMHDGEVPRLIISAD